jgi:hypothetical protein
VSDEKGRQECGVEMRGAREEGREENGDEYKGGGGLKSELSTALGGGARDYRPGNWGTSGSAIVKLFHHKTVYILIIIITIALRGCGRRKPYVNTFQRLLSNEIVF